FARATEWLKARLADGPVESLVAAREGDEFMGEPDWPEVTNEMGGEEADKGRKKHAKRAEWRAGANLKKRMGGRSRRIGFGADGHWEFHLPDQPMVVPEGPGPQFEYEGVVLTT